MNIEPLYTDLVLPLTRLILSMCLGLLLAGLVESLHWTRFVAGLASPLARIGHLRQVSAAAFALAFFSPAASNALLAEAHARNELSRRELVLTNLFNSSPAFLVHLPTVFSLALAFLGSRALIYMSLLFAAAGLRTTCTIVAGRFFLPPQAESESDAKRQSPAQKSRRVAISDTVRRLKKRITKLLFFTIPVYCVFFALQQSGWFSAMERWLAGHSAWLSFLNPKAVGIVALYLVSESGAALSAAASLADTGALAPQEIILALLVGNVISTPMRAIRHQLPAYAGYYAPPTALLLVLVNQLCRAGSLIAVAWAYYLASF